MDYSQTYSAALKALDADLQDPNSRNLPDRINEREAFLIGRISVLESAFAVLVDQVRRALPHAPIHPPMPDPLMGALKSVLAASRFYGFDPPFVDAYNAGTQEVRKFLLGRIPRYLEDSSTSDWVWFYRRCNTFGFIDRLRTHVTESAGELPEVTVGAYGHVVDRVADGLTTLESDCKSRQGFWGRIHTESRDHLAWIGGTKAIVFHHDRFVWFDPIAPVQFSVYTYSAFHRNWVLVPEDRSRTFHDFSELIPVFKELSYSVAPEWRKFDEELDTGVDVFKHLQGLHALVAATFVLNLDKLFGGRETLLHLHSVMAEGSAYGELIRIEFTHYDRSVKVLWRTERFDGANQKDYNASIDAKDENYRTVAPYALLALYMFQEKIALKLEELFPPVVEEEGESDPAAPTDP